MEKNSVNYKYLVRSPRDIDWGITVDTVGSEPIPPNYPVYPPRTGHPDAFYFTPSRGRVLDSYQLLYITHGKGYFYTSPDTFIEIKEGDILILQPHVWHSYFPDKKTGWQEYWIGFQGINMDSRFQNNFFAKDQIVYHIGVQDSIVKLYEQAIQVAMEEKAACQQYLAGIANLILGMTMYYSQNYEFDNKATEQISKAKVFIRENLLKYDEVNNEQREIIYAERRKVLDGDDMRDTIISMIDELVEKYVNMVIGDDQGPSEWNLKELNEILIPMIPVKPITGEGCGSKQELIQNLKEEALRLYETKEAEFPEPEQIREIERVIILKVTDSRWMDHIDDMDQLRQGIGLQAFGQRDPVVEYRLQGYDMFNDMTESIREETVKMLMHVRIEQKVEREQVAEVTGTNKDDSANAPVVRKSEKISRNAPCPCGSGKKYKYCCGR